MQIQNKQGIGIYFLLLFVPLSWGAAFGAAKHVITEVPPVTAAALRFGIAGIILFIIVVLSSEWNIHLIKKNWFGLLMMALTGIFGYNVFFFKGLEYTSAINGSLIMATTPVFVTLGAVIFLQEYWSKRIGIGLSLSLVGVLLVITHGSLHILKTLTFNMGDLLFVAGLICWTVHGLIGKVVLAKVSPLLTTAVTTMVGSVFLLCLSFFEKGWIHVPNMSGQSWLEILFMVVCASVIAFVLWNQGIQKIGASKASMYMNLVPINAAWISFLFYGAPINWLQILGMCLVIGGVLLASTTSTNNVQENDDYFDEESSIKVSNKC